MSEVLVANTFLKSAGGLAPNERSRAFDFLSRFYDEPTSKGRNFEVIQAAKGQNLFSARITQGLRAVVHRDGDRYTLLYAGQHDDAYNWAARRRVDLSSTGTLQIVEAAEETEQVLRRQEQEAPPTPAILPEDQFSDEYLVSLGLPSDWIPSVRMIHDEDQLLLVAGRLPDEVGERLISLASGEVVTPPAPSKSPTRDPDTLRRFWVVGEASELADLLNQPLEDWTRFLHPSQRALAEGTFKGPVKVTGSAGTGKTVVALHRARHLARKSRRVLLTTYVTTLCQNLERNLDILCTPEERARITVSTVHSRALDCVRQVDSDAHPAKEEDVRELFERYRAQAGPDLDAGFLQEEWDQVIQLQGIGTWEGYRDAERRGRGRPLSVRERKKIWDVIALVREALETRGAHTWTDLCRRSAEALETKVVESPYDTVIVDEVQDLKPPEIRFLAALGGEGPDRLMLCGDAGQRIYPGGFSLRGLGIEVRGRSHVLRINYRTTEEIRRFADRVLGESCDDLDEGTESRLGTRSLLRGPFPACQGYASVEDEVAGAVASLERLLGEGLEPTEIAVFARSGRLLDPLRGALQGGGIPITDLARTKSENQGGIRFGTMHRAKGLEFKAVLVVGASQDQLPLASVVGRITDPADREEAVDREKRLLYVSLTRARDEVVVSWVGEPSPFLTRVIGEEEAA